MMCRKKCKSQNKQRGFLLIGDAFDELRKLHDQLELDELTRESFDDEESRFESLDSSLAAIHPMHILGYLGEGQHRSDVSDAFLDTVSDPSDILSRRQSDIEDVEDEENPILLAVEDSIQQISSLLEDSCVYVKDMLFPNRVSMQARRYRKYGTDIMSFA